MKVLITGVSGFIGGSLGSYLAKRGYEVCGTIRRARLGRFQIPYAREVFAFDLGERYDECMLDDIEVLVHTAHDFTRGATERNITGTIELSSAAKKRGASRQIFLSSYSAQADAVTEYGQTKFSLEQFFGNIDGICVRPGLVIGPGGLFSRMVRMVKLLPVIPVVDGGTGRVPIIGVDQLIGALEKVMNIEDPGAMYNLFNEQLVTLKELIDATAKVLKKRRLFIPVSSKMVMKCLNVFNTMGLDLPVDVNNVRAFIHNQETQYLSDLRYVLGDKQPDLAETVRKALG